MTAEVVKSAGGSGFIGCVGRAEAVSQYTQGQLSLSEILRVVQENCVHHQRGNAVDRVGRLQQPKVDPQSNSLVLVQSHSFTSSSETPSHLSVCLHKDEDNVQ